MKRHRTFTTHAPPFAHRLRSQAAGTENRSSDLSAKAASVVEHSRCISMPHVDRFWVAFSAQGGFLSRDVRRILRGQRRRPSVLWIQSSQIFTRAAGCGSGGGGCDGMPSGDGGYCQHGPSDRAPVMEIDGRVELSPPVRSDLPVWAKN